MSPRQHIEKPNGKHREVTMKQVEQEEKRVLLCIRGVVYDVTDFAYSHPGGYQAITSLQRTDVTNIFLSTHSQRVVDTYLKIMPVYGVLSQAEQSQEPEVEQDFRRLRQLLQDKGLFETNPMLSWVKLCLYICILGLVFAGVLGTSSTLVHMCCAVLLGVYFQQIAFLGHDAGHNGITADRKSDSMFGMLAGNLLTGISMSWWKRNHNIHHIVTNSVDCDPDIQHLPFFAVSADFFKERIWSTFYNRHLMLEDSVFQYVVRVLLRYQHLLYYLVMAVARINLYAQSILLSFELGPYSPQFMRGEQVFNRPMEKASLLFFWSWMLFLHLQLSSIPEALCFFLLTNAVAGLLHVQITLSHFSRPTHRGISSQGFVQTQMEGTLNVSTSVWTDWFHGGLQWQIEHHLFPRIPRHHLRAASKYVREFCAKHGLEYVSLSFYEANLETMRVLRESSREFQQFNPIIWEGWNAFG